MNPLASPCRHFRYADDTPGIDKLGLGIAAGDYQRLGYAVLPLQRGAKKPHRMLGETGGVHHASLAGADVSRWWGADPAANIGVATGTRSHLAVIDMDVKNSKNGPAELIRFLGSIRGSYTIPEGCWVRTPSGGVHVWLRTPAGLVVPERPGILPGVDIKGDGGLVVVPPSMQMVSGLARPGEPGGQVPIPYQWNGCPCQAPPAPPWLLEWIYQAQSAAAGSLPEEDVPDARELIKTGVPRGERNNTLYRLACSLYRRHGTASMDVMSVLRDVWSAGDMTGFPWSEVLTIADSARRFVAQQERGDAIVQQQTMGWLER